MKSKKGYRICLMAMLTGTYACQQPSAVEYSLTLAGENRTELQTLLDHYTEDPEKGQAARFLVENMSGHYTLESEASDRFRSEADSLFTRGGRKDAATWQMVYDSIVRKYRFNETGMTELRDVQHLKADYLIAHIDSMFKVWREDPWVEEYSFEHFCNYVLPYRVTTEPVSTWFGKYRNISMKHFRDYSNLQGNRLHKMAVHEKVRGYLKQEIYYADGYVPTLPLATLPSMRIGDCETYAAYSVALLRAFGLPAAVDFTPQWGNRSMGHSWAVYLPATGEPVPFTSDDPIGEHFFLRQTEYLPKVFRKMYAKQSDMLELKKMGEYLPELFDTPYLKDVTDDYIATSDIDVPLFPGLKDKVVYLTVFDNRHWRVVHYGDRKGDRAHFSQMGRNIAYLPVTYTEEGTLLPAGHPFILHPNGRMQTLQTDTVQTENVTLLRKYKTSPALTSWTERINDAEFQMATKKDFSDAVTIAKTGTSMECRFNRLATDYEGRFRYLRFASTHSWSEVAEMELYGDNGTLLKPDILQGANVKEVECCFDGDPLTFSGNNRAGKARIELEFDTPVHIDSIRILPRNDDNFIREGEEYRLYFWDGTGWELLKEMTGNREGALHADNVPGNALLLLRNITKGREERIFTSENGKQVWW